MLFFNTFLQILKNYPVVRKILSKKQNDIFEKNKKIADLIKTAQAEHKRQQDARLKSKEAQQLEEVQRKVALEALKQEFAASSSSSTIR